VDTKQPEDESMTRAKKTEANRRDALKSTGPKTLRGRPRYASTAVKHVLLSRDVLLSPEKTKPL
jgi:hypothetical protein